jgi:outer membrane protein assembly factor BamE (lipoprotein component of BamABCDE complex)
MRKFVAVVSVIVIALAGCDSKRAEKLEEGVSTEADVRAQFGEPVAVYTDASDGYGGGAKTLEYPRQPEGQTTYMISIGADGKMSALRQVLKPSEFAKVTPGLDKAQVRRLLGRPAATQRFELKNEEQWDWRWLDGQASKLFSVTFDPDGRVATTAIVDDPRVVSPGG